MLDWHWTPGAGGLLALVPPHVLEGRGVVVPEGAAAVRPLHLTCLASRSMAPLVGTLDPAEVLPRLPRMPLPDFVAGVETAHRPPHPVKDPPGTRTSRETGFLAATPDSQLTCHAVLREVVRILALSSQACGGPDFPHPEPDRFFHLSVWNNRGGDAMRSIGDICAADLGATVASNRPRRLP